MKDALIRSGRCRSGRRWFWAAQRNEWGGHNCTKYGWADTEAEATALADKAAADLVAGDDYLLDPMAGVASEILKEINRAKRLSRPPSGVNESTVIEYLYSASHCAWDGQCGCDSLTGRAKWDYHVRRHPIVKKTAHRIYYRIEPERPDGWPGPEENVGYVDRQQLQAKGEVWVRAHPWSVGTLYLNYPEPPPLYSDQRTADRKERLRRLKAEAAAVHPDREGGSHEAFLAAYRRYEAEARR